MKQLLNELNNLPEAARECYEKNKQVLLPLSVPYLGMGASYFAAKTLRHKQIHPTQAFEYFLYGEQNQTDRAVLISQSGETSELLWCAERFKDVIVITNNPLSSLAKAHNASEMIELHAGDEDSSATKTYINTLITLYLGLQHDPKNALEFLSENYKKIKTTAEAQAGEIVSYLKNTPRNGLYVLGSGPNSATAQEAALALSETTKYAWIGMPVALFDHGPKETANNSVIIFLNSNGKDANRQALLKHLLAQKSNALVVSVNHTEMPEDISPFILIAHMYWIMYYIIKRLKIKKTYSIGGKITRFR